MSVKVVKQYEQGVLFRFGRLIGTRDPGLRIIVPFVDRLHRVSLRVVTCPIQSQGIITRDNVSVDVSAVAYYKIVDAVRSVVGDRGRAQGDRPDRSDDAAKDRRQAHARRDPVRDRPDQLDIRGILDEHTSRGESR
jgi:regulator of protease activity HflC (stomatin/prohibitin superfamily)